MCGIYGYIGENAVNEVLEGIKRLEYRGYDSAGIAYVKINENNKKLSNFSEKIEKSCQKDIKNTKYRKNISVFENDLKVVKEVGQVDCLRAVVDKIKENGSIAIGHTRWATHGKPCIENSHPHISADGRWAIVHNGIIENFQNLKIKLKGYPFKSQTDSEVVAGLLQQNFNGDVLDTLIRVCAMIKGSYAFAIIYTLQPDKIFVAKNNSPVVVGIGKNSGIVCSDINSLESADEVFILENHQFAAVEKGNVEVFDENKNKIQLKKVDVENFERINLGKYPHFMLKEIEEIPLAIEKTAIKYNDFEKIEKVLPINIVKNITEVILIGCGTAFHASLMGKSIIERECNLKSTALIASEFVCDEFLWGKDTLAIFVSQSGETADTLKALKKCKEKGIKTLAITNVKNSSICQEADFVLYTSAGCEIAVASTKAYNCQLALFYLIASYINIVKRNYDKKAVFDEYRQLCNIAKEIENLDNKKVSEEVSEKIKDSRHIYMIGRDFDYKTAMEASLKLKEISYIHSEAYPAGELKHGTISLITCETFVFAFITQKKLKEKTLSNISEIVSRGGKVILLTQFDDIGGGYEQVIRLPNVDEKYIPLVSIVYMQLIAYFTSLKLGNNPDKPRALAKSVTVE